MTRYTVVWPKGTEDDLIEIWLNASDRDAITAAVNAVDRQLCEDAAAKRSELREGLRAFVERPLRILYSVRDNDRIVEILRVKRA